jgi:CheY-like chemotaxis protein
VLEIIGWLAGIELKVGALYEEAAELFAGDKKFSEFLNHLADDEAWHHRVIKTSAEIFRKDIKADPLIYLDTETETKIESYISRIKESLANNKLNKRSTVEGIVSAEFSEWNHIFLYVVHTMEECHIKYGHVAPKIQQHISYIERYVEKLPDCEAALSRIRALPPVWEERILLVDDSRATLELLSTILKAQAIIETAQDGNEAYEKVCRQYFAVILSDIEMPVMDGIEFYRRCVNDYPGINKRFLFLAGNPAPDRVSFLRKNKLRFLRKPVSISEIKRSVFDIIQSSTKQ